jgi:hypothetical protein
MTPADTPPTSSDALDADIVAALTAAQADLPPNASGTESPEVPTDAMLARVRQRLMQRIAQDSTPLHLTVPADDAQWRPFLPGIDRKMLHRHASTPGGPPGGLMSYLLRLAPGAVLPAHHHPVDEECVVLSGVLKIGNALEVPAGGFHMGRQNVAHEAITTELGAVIYLRGAAPAAETMIG